MENYISYLMTFLLFENIHRKLPLKILIQFLFEITLSESPLFLAIERAPFLYDSF